jgi:ribosomal protein S18 acetylase RimI-like enzyme
MPVTIRTARPSEYAAVGDLTVAAYRALPVDHLWGGYEADIREVAGRAKASDVLVAVEGNRLLGSVTLVTEPDSPWLEWTAPGEVQFRLLAVDANTRGRGVGTALVRECLARTGTRPVLIHTTKWMTAALRLYPTLGFERRPDRDVAYEVWNEEGSPDVPPEWIGEKFLAYGRAAAGYSG